MKFCILIGFLSATFMVYGEANSASTTQSYTADTGRGYYSDERWVLPDRGIVEVEGRWEIDRGRKIARQNNIANEFAEDLDTASPDAVQAAPVCKKVCLFPPMDVEGHILPYHKYRRTPVRNQMLSLRANKIARSEKSVSHFFPQVGAFLKPYIGTKGLGKLSYNSRYALAEKMWALNPKLRAKARRAREKEERRRERLNLPPPSCYDGGCGIGEHCPGGPSNPIPPVHCSSVPVKKANYNLALFSRNVKYLESLLGRDRVKKLIRSDMRGLLNAPYPGYYESSPIIPAIKFYLGEKEGKKWIQKVVDSGGLSALNLHSANIKRLDNLLDKFEDRYGKDLTFKVLKENPELFGAEDLNPLIKKFHTLDPKKPKFKAPVPPVCTWECSDSGEAVPPAPPSGSPRVRGYFLPQEWQSSPKPLKKGSAAQ